jgi:hypothetical protein
VGAILGAEPPVDPTTGGRGIEAAGGGGGMEALGGGGGIAAAPTGLLSFNFGAELASPSEEGGGGGGGGVSRLIVVLSYQVLERG